jgi:hypothetical protein
LQVNDLGWGRVEYSRAGKALQLMLKKAHSYQNLIKEGVVPKRYVKEQQPAEVGKKAEDTIKKHINVEFVDKIDD